MSFLAQEGSVATSSGWDCVKGRLLESRFEIGDLIQALPQGARFHVRDLENGEECLASFEDAGTPGANDDFDRFREAAFLQHPNLVDVRAAGSSECQGKKFIYLITEMAELDLAELLQQRPMTVDEAADLLRQVVAGLEYIHLENLVYCALRAGAVWRVGDKWKLADYTQLRVAGKHPVSETRRLLLMPAFEAPPEANEGTVTQAWDVWSLGSMLRKIFLRPAADPRLQRSGSLPKHFIPPPFDRIIREALQPEPSQRPTLAQMVSWLASPEIMAPPEVTKPRETFVEENLYAPELATPEEPVPSSRSARVEHGSRRWAVPMVLGGIIAAVVAATLALVFPTRMIHPQQATSAPAPTSPAPASAEAAADANPAPAEPAHSPFVDTPASGPKVSQLQRDISQVLNRWVDAKRHRDVEKEVACYAPAVDKFYGQHRLSSAQLRSEEQNVFSRVGTIRRFDISNLTFNKVSPDWAVVSFDKNWDFEGRTRFAGSSREELVLRPIHGQWKISSQREVKVYWVDKQPT